jgi:hypothetical protein
VYSFEVLCVSCQFVCITQGPIAIGAAKKAIDMGLQADIATGMRIEEACYAQVC